MEKVVRFVFSLSLILMLVVIAVVLGYTMYIGLHRSSGINEIDFPRPLLEALCILTIVFVICIFLMCIFEIIHIYKISGVKGIFIIGIIFVIVFSGAFLFNKVLLEEDNSLIQSFKLTLGIMALGFMINSYKRTKKEK